MYIYDTTLREICGAKSTFPVSLRQIICQSVKDIPTEEMDQLLSKSETDPNNFDGRIEANIRSHSPGDITISTNHPISNQTKFNCDIVIHMDDVSVCLEIEKGYLARFELDILKMQVLADTLRQKVHKKQIYGAFIVPADNVVARHISGNRNESSFKYLIRLSRLICEMESLSLSDILIVGYRKTEPEVGDKSKKNLADRLAKGPPGIDMIKEVLPSYPLNQVARIREKLYSEIPRLQEHLNTKGRYLSYSNGEQSHALYVYIQKKRLVLDIRASKEYAEKVRKQGFKVNPKNNYQGKAGWLTGVSVPHESDRLNVVMELALLALEE